MESPRYNIVLEMMLLNASTKVKNREKAYQRLLELSYGYAIFSCDDYPPMLYFSRVERDSRGGINVVMAISYTRLWKLLIDRRMSQAELRKAVDIAPNTMTKLRRDQEVSLSVLDRICDALNVDYADIMEHVSDYDQKKTNVQ